MLKIATILLISHYIAAMGIWNYTEIFLTIQDLNLLETDAFLLYFAFQTTFWSDTILRQTNPFVPLLSLARAPPEQRFDDAKQSPNVNIFSNIKKPNQTKNPSI